jgi:hypothetical protein
MDASTVAFQLYTVGVFADYTCSKVTLNQYLVAIGYGHDDSGGDYWIVQNSWGVSWGEKGIIRVLRGQNICGVATSPIYTVLQ